MKAPRPAAGKAEEAVKPPRASVFIVDDHAVVRDGLTALIDREPDLYVCGWAENAENALPQIRSRRPRVAVVDISLGGRSGLELVALLRQRCPDVLVLVLSMHDESLYAERCLKAGARGYVMKSEAMSEVRAAIRRILEGKVYLSRSMTERLLDGAAMGQAPSRSPVASLSDREREVFELIGRGLATAEIARTLCLSVKTIESHRAKIKRKLALRSGTELARHAIAWFEEPR